MFYSIVRTDGLKSTHDVDNGRFGILRFYDDLELFS